MEYEKVKKILKMVMDANRHGLELSFSISHNNTIMGVIDVRMGCESVIQVYDWPESDSPHHIDNATKILQEYIECHK